MTNTDTADARSQPDNEDHTSAPETIPAPDADQDPASETAVPMTAEEIGGPKGPEPTRYGDWEKKGRCIDF